MTNLLINPNFDDGFTGWSSVNDFWMIHRQARCDPSVFPTNMAEMDQDRGRDGTIIGWAVGDEDWLVQQILVNEPHVKLIFSMRESHHMVSGVAEVRIYGSLDGGIWTEIFHRPQADPSSYGAGKNCSLVPTFTYEILKVYPHYRLEFHGRMDDAGDGWLFGELDLHTE